MPKSKSRLRIASDSSTQPRDHTAKRLSKFLYTGFSKEIENNNKHHYCEHEYED